MNDERFYDPHQSFTDHLYLVPKDGEEIEIGVWIDDDYHAIDLDRDSVVKLRRALQRWERANV